jgi:hypothetical protein
VTLGIGFAMWHDSKEKPTPPNFPKRLLVITESNSDLGQLSSSQATMQAMPADNLQSSLPLPDDGPLLPSVSAEPNIQDNRSQNSSFVLSPVQIQSRSKQESKEFVFNESGSKIKVDLTPDPEQEVLGLIKDFHQAASLEPSKPKEKPNILINFFEVILALETFADLDSNWEIPDAANFETDEIMKNLYGFENSWYKTVYDSSAWTKYLLSDGIDRDLVSEDGKVFWNGKDGKREAFGRWDPNFTLQDLQALLTDHRVGIFFPDFYVNGGEPSSKCEDFMRK